MHTPIDPDSLGFTAKVIVQEVLDSKAVGSRENKAFEKLVYECIVWWALLKRSGYPVQFGHPSSKRTKVM